MANEQEKIFGATVCVRLLGNSPLLGGSVIRGSSLCFASIVNVMAVLPCLTLELSIRCGQ